MTFNFEEALSKMKEKYGENPNMDNMADFFKGFGAPEEPAIKWLKEKYPGIFIPEKWKK